MTTKRELREQVSSLQLSNKALRTALKNHYFKEAALVRKGLVSKEVVDYGQISFVKVREHCGCPCRGM